MAARRSYGRRSHYGYPRYVPISERQYLSSQQINSLKDSGAKLSPVVIQGRTIASTFWGKAWCDNVESYQDYSNRLPRGRTYVRSGAVIDLQIKEGHISAKVMGSSLYSIEMDIKKIPSEKWQQLKHDCAGKISSLVDLISGRLSPEIMTVLCRKKDGMFPSPDEIKMTCSCPDWASLCKHLAAVLYGIGARLDTQPELFFLLRGVDQKELLSNSIVEAAVEGATQGAISDGDLKGIFDIDLDEPDGQTPAQDNSSNDKAAAVTAATPAPATAKRQPGRPKKAPAAASINTAAAKTKTAPAPAKRQPGRPQKAPAVPSINTAAAPAPAKRKPGRPQKAPAAASINTAAAPAPAKRQPGRPQKASAVPSINTAPAPTAKRQPGRPQKASAVPSINTAAMPTAKRKPGRPRKTVTAAPPAAEKGQPRKRR